ncbi:hypothetical protein KIPB_002181 [Kipferlia bialata]|uniref:Uncharacterized protein n=1 Tax=Kipferlia bialata TaxID=797122 RepID=A0A9K3GFX7_9EUKA|nr:hypothetical protein KIPB_002181 [Kipferlia bialata]|eukprot:g2181.t1
MWETPPPPPSASTISSLALPRVLVVEDFPPLVDYREFYRERKYNENRYRFMRDPSHMTGVHIGERRVMVCQICDRHCSDPIQNKFILEESLAIDWDDRSWFSSVTCTETCPEQPRANDELVMPHEMERGSDGYLSVCRVQDKVLYVGLSKEADQSYIHEYDIPTENWVRRDMRSTILEEVDRRRAAGELDLLTPKQWSSLMWSRESHLNTHRLRIHHRDRFLKYRESLRELEEKLKTEGGTEGPFDPDSKHCCCPCFEDEDRPTHERLQCCRFNVHHTLEHLQDCYHIDGHQRLVPGVLEREREAGERRREWLRACDGPERQYESFWRPPAHNPITCCLDGKLVVVGGYTTGKKIGEKYRSRSVSLYDPETRLWCPLPDIPGHIDVGSGTEGHAVSNDTLYMFREYTVPMTAEEAAIEAKRAHASGEDGRPWYRAKTTRSEFHHISLALAYRDGRVGCKWKDAVVDGCNFLPEGSLIGLPGRKILALGDIAKEACLYDCVSGEWYMIGHLFPEPSEQEEESLHRSWQEDGPWRGVDSRFTPYVLTMSIYSIVEGSVSVLVTFIPHERDRYHRDKPSYGVLTLSSELLFGTTLLNMPRWDGDEAKERASSRNAERVRQVAQYQ